MNRIVKRLLVSLAVGVITFILSFTGAFYYFDGMLTDAVYQQPLDKNNSIKIVAIDEKTLDEFGPLNTWSREIYADLLDRLYQDPENSPAIVVFDMIFQGETDADADLEFAQAAEEAGGVVSAVNIVFSESIKADSNGNKYLDRLNVDMIEYPFEGLFENAFIGFANTIQDGRDGSIRDFYPVLSTPDGEVPSLALATARALQERGQGEINIPDTAAGESLIIRYTGGAGYYDAISLSDILNGNIAPEVFRNNILLVGAYAPGMMDAFSVPSDSGQMYGVEIHANVLESIQQGRYMQHTSALLYSLIFAVVAFLFMMLALSVKFFISIIAAVAIIVIEILSGAAISNNHVFIPLITLPICIVLSEVGCLVYRYLSSLAQRRRVLKAFRQYVAPQVVEEIAKKGNFELSLGGRRRDVAVLFVDIRGFTPMSESLEPEQVVEVLNEYLSLTTKAIFDNMGTLDKFVGDATMAVFNSPFDLDDYVYRAVCAARDIVAGSEDIRKKAFEMTGREVSFGVGVNCGPAVVGNIGCDFRMDYTAIGDTVNTAARLESNAKAGQVLLSQAVVDALGDRIETEAVGEIPLKGKSEPFMVYSLKL